MCAAIHACDFNKIKQFLSCRSTRVLSPFIVFAWLLLLVICMAAFTVTVSFHTIVKVTQIISKFGNNCGRYMVCIFILYIPYAGVPEFQQNEDIISVVNTTASSIAIQWQPATTFPIVPVTEYIISLYSDTGLQDIFEFLTNVTMLSFTISELEPSTTYHISIVAVNSIGASEPTANFTVITQSLGMFVYTV